MASTTASALGWLIVGLVLGALVATVALGPTTGTSVPSHSLVAVGGCVGPDDPRGWVGVVPGDDHQGVYLGNLTVHHEAPAVETAGTLREDQPGEWILAVTLTPTESGTERPADCSPRTLIDAAVALPPDADTLTVALDGDTLTTVGTNASRARFHPLE